MQKQSSRFQSRLSDAQWAEARRAWETTPNLTFAAVGRAQSPAVTGQAVSKRAKREGWAKRVVYPSGRPTVYCREYDKKAYQLCLLGATDKQLAEFFEVHESTINNWKHSQLSFLESIKEGKMAADANVTEALYSRAIGYSHSDVHIAVVDGEIVQTETVKHYPPCTASAIFWLKNRQPKLWREKVELESEVNVNMFPPKEELDAIYEKALAEAEEIEERILGGRAERLGINLDGVGHDSE